MPSLIGCPQLPKSHEPKWPLTKNNFTTYADLLHLSRYSIPPSSSNLHLAHHLTRSPTHSPGPPMLLPIPPNRIKPGVNPHAEPRIQREALPLRHRVQPRLALIELLPLPLFVLQRRARTATTTAILRGRGRGWPRGRVSLQLGFLDIDPRQDRHLVVRGGGRVIVSGGALEDGPAYMGKLQVNQLTNIPHDSASSVKKEKGGEGEKDISDR